MGSLKCLGFLHGFFSHISIQDYGNTSRKDIWSRARRKPPSSSGECALLHKHTHAAPLTCTGNCVYLFFFTVYLPKYWVSSRGKLATALLMWTSGVSWVLVSGSNLMLLGDDDMWEPLSDRSPSTNTL